MTPTILPLTQVRLLLYVLSPWCPIYTLWHTHRVWTTTCSRFRCPVHLHAPSLPPCLRTLFVSIPPCTFRLSFSVHHLLHFHGWIAIATEPLSFAQLGWLPPPPFWTFPTASILFSFISFSSYKYKHSAHYNSDRQQCQSLPLSFKIVECTLSHDNPVGGSSPYFSHTTAGHHGRTCVHVCFRGVVCSLSQHVSFHQSSSIFVIFPCKWDMYDYTLPWCTLLPLRISRNKSGSGSSSLQLFIYNYRLSRHTLFHLHHPFLTRHLQLQAHWHKLQVSSTLYPPAIIPRLPSLFFFPSIVPHFWSDEPTFTFLTVCVHITILHPFLLSLFSSTFWSQQNSGTFYYFLIWLWSTTIPDFHACQLHICFFLWLICENVRPLTLEHKTTAHVSFPLLNVSVHLLHLLYNYTNQMLALSTCSKYCAKENVTLFICLQHTPIFAYWKFLTIHLLSCTMTLNPS